MKPSFDVLDREDKARQAATGRRLLPRLRVRDIVVSLAVVYALYCYFFSKPLLVHPLPQHTGPYAVGAIDIEAPVSLPRTIHSAQFKGTDEKAFELETVLFTLYYPTTYAAAKSSATKRHTWIPKPLSLRAQGYARAAHISNWFTDKLFTAVINSLVGGITIPAAVDAPLSGHATPTSQATDSEQAKQHPRTSDDGPSGGYPVIIFSHGTVSARTDYSHYAGELAARGHVVVMLEHRDGSSPGTVIKQHNQPNQTRLLFDVSAVETPEGSQSLTVEEFHQAQLNFRQAEIEEAVHVIKRINTGHGAQIATQNPYREGADLPKWANRLNTHAMIMAGHSYGATGALQALRGGPTDARPFRAAIVLDPGKQSGPLNGDVHVPLLVVHSNTWSSSRRRSSSVLFSQDGRAHFDTVRAIVAANNARGHPSWFMTSIGTSHPSVTDAPLLEPWLLSFTTGATIDVYQGLRQYVHAAEDFLAFVAGGEVRGLMAERAEFPRYDEGAKMMMMGKPGQGGEKGTLEDLRRGEWADWRRYWQIHVSPVGEGPEGGKGDK
ncbi:platelet-activating factor acetylhydrolase, isoform II-domain-containing protein [Chaetomidium leptoderma]|uniref:Putative phospholipase n=1 Tax=Chaetomidium leptoderma TaxID=669021 RepID=A0AAN6VBL3_9PEZI|nr:platelet-activating factor acetylhydrolase, isoform II-domain-containing protein [Chaetomidium leptoderma]